MKIRSKEEAYEAIKDNLRMMHRVKIPLYTISFHMKKIMSDWNISKKELENIRRQIIRELSYIIV